MAFPVRANRKKGWDGVAEFFGHDKDSESDRIASKRRYLRHTKEGISSTGKTASAGTAEFRVAQSTSV
jgi:hypothetical protein